MQHQSLVKDSLQMSVELLDVVLLVKDRGHAGRGWGGPATLAVASLEVCVHSIRQGVAFIC